MPRNDTLGRVDEDMAAGRVLTALARLQGLVRAYPHDLELRHRLAEVYRGLGESAQAGRWAYLSPDLTDAERAAFTRQFPDPVHRMRVLGWDGTEEQAPTRLTRDRLAELRGEAELRIGDRMAYAALGRRRHVRHGGLLSGAGSLDLFGLSVLLVLGTLGLVVFVVAQVARSMF